MNELNKTILPYLPSIHFNINNDVFINQCMLGNMHVIQKLLQIKPNINISDDYERAFRFACIHGHLDVAQWLLQIKPDIEVSAKKGAGIHKLFSKLMSEIDWKVRNGLIQTIKRNVIKDLSDVEPQAVKAQTVGCCVIT